jgi:sterol desaturase/sphingolipid hydroxylase (fatty acid hydroxylase superfamily)
MEPFSLADSLITAMGIFSLYLVLYAMFLPFEATFPAEKGHTIRGRARNIFMTLVFLVSGTVVVSWLFSFIPRAGQNTAEFFSLWNLVVILFYILVLDFLFYWYHRAEHTLSWLWPVHELHHSDRELNITTSYRTYWLERPLQALCIGLPASFAIGDIAIAYAYALVILTAWEFFTHANLRLNLGFLTPLVCGPQLHRIHHSRLPEHQNKNFAQYYPFIDILFGTYYRPAQNEFPETGLHNVDSNMSVAKITIRPFVMWYRKIMGAHARASNSVSIG